MELVLFSKIICWPGHLGTIIQILRDETAANWNCPRHEGDKGSTQWSSKGHHHLNVRHGCCQDKNRKDNEHGDLIWTWTHSRKLLMFHWNWAPTCNLSSWKKWWFPLTPVYYSFSSSCAEGWTWWPLSVSASEVSGTVRRSQIWVEETWQWISLNW